MVYGVTWRLFTGPFHSVRVVSLTGSDAQMLQGGRQPDPTNDSAWEKSGMQNGAMQLVTGFI